MILSLEEQVEFWKPYFEDTKKLLVTSAKGKQDCQNWHRYFSLTLFEFWYKRYDLFFPHKNYLQKQPLADVLSENLFLKLSQYSQENTWRLEDMQLYYKETPKLVFFLWLLGNFYEHFFNSTSPLAASVGVRKNAPRKKAPRKNAPEKITPRK